MFKAPRGTRDILPSESEKWHHVEEIIRRICQDYGYGEIRTSLFEQTELFARGVGENTDIVEKEMYSFKDRSHRSLTLRPEGTAAVVRAFLEHKMYKETQTQKLYYLGPMFRYDRPQAGRYRQFYQFGIEAFGSGRPVLDTEVIALGHDFFQRLGLKDLRLELNSVGCSVCRPAYGHVLMEYFQDQLAGLCSDCQVRFQSSSLRILDCKNEDCAHLAQGAPSLLENLCPECEEHFSQVLEMLQGLGIDYNVNHKLVRGLDYYTRTAFEYILPEFGVQSSLGGGGRYDNLVAVCGGPPTPGVGLAVGLERVLLALGKMRFLKLERQSKGVLVALAGQNLDRHGLLLLQELRKNGIKADMDFSGRSLKGQMKFANKGNFLLVIILGERELQEGLLTLREMESGRQEELPYTEAILKIKKYFQ